MPVGMDGKRQYGFTLLLKQVQEYLCILLLWKYVNSGLLKECFSKSSAGFHVICSVSIHYITESGVATEYHILYIFSPVFFSLILL